MTVSAPARPFVRLWVAVIAALAISPLAGQPVAAAGDLLPDLRIAQPYNISVATNGSGRIKLRFGTLVWNVGDGPLQVRAKERSGKVMTDIVQWIKQAGGGGRAYRPDGATAFYSGDGHNHWHIGRFIVVTLARPPTVTDPPDDTSAPRGLRKIGFCLVDLVRAPAGELRPANSARRAQYRVSGCGDRTSTSLRMGISVGYGDDYKPHFTHQAIDVTTLPPGVYRLCATVNADGTWLEVPDGAANNSYWLDLDLDPVANMVSVVGGGHTTCDTTAPTTPGTGG